MFAQGLGASSRFDSGSCALSAIVHATRLPGEEPLRLDGYRVLHPVAKRPEQYGMALASIWQQDAAIVNIEHDHPATPELVAELLACPHPLCTHAYQMHLPTTYWAHSTRADAMDGFWIEQGAEWAAYSAIGFCKIAPEARTRPLGPAVWQAVELEVNNATTGPSADSKWHVHWNGAGTGQGIEHFHKEPRDG